VLRVSLTCKVFLDHPQNYRVCWRGSRPSPVRVSDKQNIKKWKIKTNLRKLGLDKLDWIDFEDDKKLVDAKRKTKKTENYTKSNKRLNLDHLFPSNAARKKDLLTVYICIKLQVDLQADKSSVVVKGTFFPRVMNPRYRICGTNVSCKSWSNKAEKLWSSRGETYASNFKEHHGNESNL
jgi:hypothetical protein